MFFNVANNGGFPIRKLTGIYSVWIACYTEVDRYIFRMDCLLYRS